MSRLFSGIRLSLSAAALLLVLLAVLATLQYRWIGQVSEAERERMRASARRAADGVGADFNREISRALDHFGLPPQFFGERGNLGPLIAEAAKHWATESRFPALVAEVLVAQRLTDEKIQLDRVNLSSGLMEPSAWPSDLGAARQWIESGQEISSAVVLPGQLERRVLGPPRAFGPQLLDEVPAILIPDMRRLGSPGEFGEGITAQRWVILRFDRRAILTVFLPELIRRHFGDIGEYDVAVLRRENPGEVLYRSREGFPPTPVFAPDAEVFFFGGGLGPGGPNTGEVFYRSREGFPPTPASAPDAEVFFFGGGLGPGGPNTEVRLRSPNEDSAERSSERRGDHPFVRLGLGGGAWRLVAIHRAGSLQAAVQATRRRNLAVSGAVLLLLALAIGALLTSARRAQRLARQQLEFVAGLTHELRTPLAAIRSAGQNLADGLVSDRDRVRQYGTLLEREGRRLSGLIEDALAHAGIEARREGVRNAAVAIPEILEEAITACRPLAQEHAASLETEIAAALPPVAGNPSALRTLFENLISNAIKYGSDAGPVHVRASEAGPSIEVSVRDQGPGISPRDLPRIFEPFYRGAEVSSGRVSGSGLGLSLVRRIAEAHGGRVVVESESGKGTTFRVTLPAVREPAGGLSSEVGVAS